MPAQDTPPGAFRQVVLGNDVVDTSPEGKRARKSAGAVLRASEGAFVGSASPGLDARPPGEDCRLPTYEQPGLITFRAGALGMPAVMQEFGIDATQIRHDLSARMLTAPR